MTIAYGNQAKYGATAADAATKYQIENDDICTMVDSRMALPKSNRIEIHMNFRIRNDFISLRSFGFCFFFLHLCCNSDTKRHYIVVQLFRREKKTTMPSQCYSSITMATSIDMKAIK